MGLLDDAIREHLDLQRRRGADPAEVERSEREALGPVRRAPERAPDDDLPVAEVAEHEDVVGPEVGYEDEELDYDGYDEPAESPAHAEPFAAETEAPLQPGTDSWSYETGAADDRASEPDPAPPAPHHAETFATEPPPAAEPSAHGDPQRHGYADHTVEFDVEEALGAERAWHDEPQDAAPAEGGDEDVLEETPEFLQDTPDHDRLWFEQRPPRDFDFDK